MASLCSIFGRERYPIYVVSTGIDDLWLGIICAFDRRHGGPFIDREVHRAGHILTFADAFAPDEYCAIVARVVMELCTLDQLLDLNLL